MKICFKSKFLSAVVLSIFVFACSSTDLSTPDKTVDTLYCAISKKDAGLYAKCFYEHGELNTSEIKLAARYGFAHLRILRYKIIQRENVAPDEVKLTIQEVSQRENGIKISSTFVARFIKVGKQWKILDSKTIEFKKIE
jgi:hypothetical protein